MDSMLSGRRRCETKRLGTIHEIGMRARLVLAGIYNLIFGAWVVLWPSSIFSWLGMERPRTCSCGSASA